MWKKPGNGKEEKKVSDENVYIAIDLKSFYASCECVERGLDPLSTNLVVADRSRSEKTICLAVSPPLKAYGIPGRARLFEVIRAVKEINCERRRMAPGHRLTGKSCDAEELHAHPEFALDFYTAVPRMSHYIKCSTFIYEIYLRYFAPEDMHIYSIDEVFIDVTHYLDMYRMTPGQLAMNVIRDVLDETGITATAGIGTNLYLCKIAMDILAKKEDPDENGVRIAFLDEAGYRKKLWDHRPITDFWRVGKGTAKKLASAGMYTMRDIAVCSEGKTNEYYNEDLLYGMFGVNAELLIDHAWGRESCTMADIKSYKPKEKSVGSGQVLERPYRYEEARLAAMEMADALALELAAGGLVTDQIVMTVGYDISNMEKGGYNGPAKTDHYGRKVPLHAHGSENLGMMTSSSVKIKGAAAVLFDRIVDRDLLVRRIIVNGAHIVEESRAMQYREPEQIDLFTDYEKAAERRQAEKRIEEKEKSLQQARLSIQKKFGKNAVFLGMDLQEGATAIKRNGQIGGHRK